MNLRTFTLVGRVAIAALLTPAAANAQGRGGHGGGRASGASMQSASRTAPAASASRFSGAGGARSFAGRGDRWHNRTGGDRSHYRHYRRYGGYYYGGYPYFGNSFGYGYGYGYPYGYGYGYPYFGASADLYYNGTRPYGRAEYDAGNDGSVVVDVQRRLARAGYYHGAVDGVVGNGTRKAIRAYERANRLPVDGQIDQDLLSRMGVS